eukprot:g18.t1
MSLLKDKNPSVLRMPNEAAVLAHHGLVRSETGVITLVPPERLHLPVQTQARARAGKNKDVDDEKEPLLTAGNTNTNASQLQEKDRQRDSAEQAAKAKRLKRIHYAAAESMKLWGAVALLTVFFPVMWQLGFTSWFDAQHLTLCNYAILCVFFLAGAGSRYEQILANTVVNIAGTCFACFLGICWALIILKAFPRDVKLANLPREDHIIVEDGWDPLIRGYDAEGNPQYRIIQEAQLPDFTTHLWMFVFVFLGTLFVFQFMQNHKYFGRWKRPVGVCISAWTMIMFGVIGRHQRDDTALEQGARRNAMLRLLRDGMKELKVDPPEYEKDLTFSAEAQMGAPKGVNKITAGTWLKEKMKLDLDALIKDSQWNLERIGQEHSASLLVSVLQRSAGVFVGLVFGVLFALLLPNIFPKLLPLRKAKDEVLANTRQAVVGSFDVLLTGFRKYSNEQDYRQKLLDGVYLLEIGGKNSNCGEINGRAAAASACSTSSGEEDEQQNMPKASPVRRLATRDLMGHEDDEEHDAMLEDEGVAMVAEIKLRSAASALDRRGVGDEDEHFSEDGRPDDPLTKLQRLNLLGRTTTQVKLDPEEQLKDAESHQIVRSISVRHAAGTILAAPGVPAVERMSAAVDVFNRPIGTPPRVSQQLYQRTSIKIDHGAAKKPSPRVSHNDAEDDVGRNGKSGGARGTVSTAAGASPGPGAADEPNVLESATQDDDMSKLKLELFPFRTASSNHEPLPTSAAITVSLSTEKGNLHQLSEQEMLNAKRRLSTSTQVSTTARSRAELRQLFQSVVRKIIIRRRVLRDLETLASIDGKQAEWQAAIALKFYETNNIWAESQTLKQIVQDSVVPGALLRWLPGMDRASKGYVTCLSNLQQWVSLSNFWRFRFTRTATSLSPKENLPIPMADLTEIVERLQETLAALLDPKMHVLLNDGVGAERERMAAELSADHARAEQGSAVGTLADVQDAAGLGQTTPTNVDHSPVRIDADKAFDQGVGSPRGAAANDTDAVLTTRAVDDLEANHTESQSSSLQKQEGFFASPASTKNRSVENQKKQKASPLTKGVRKLQARIVHKISELRTVSGREREQLILQRFLTERNLDCAGETQQPDAKEQGAGDEDQQKTLDLPLKDDRLAMYMYAQLHNFDRLCSDFEALAGLLNHWRDDIFPQILARDRFQAICKARQAAISGHTTRRRRGLAGLDEDDDDVRGSRCSSGGRSEDGSSVDEGKDAMKQKDLDGIMGGGLGNEPDEAVAAALVTTSSAGTRVRSASGPITGTPAKEPAAGPESQEDGDGPTAATFTRAGSGRFLRRSLGSAFGAQLESPFETEDLNEGSGGQHNPYKFGSLHVDGHGKTVQLPAEQSLLLTTDTRKTRHAFGLLPTLSSVGLNINNGGHDGGGQPGNSGTASGATGSGAPHQTETPKAQTASQIHGLFRRKNCDTYRSSAKVAHEGRRNSMASSVDCQVAYSWRFTHFLGSLSYLLEDWSAFAEELLKLLLPRNWALVRSYKKRLIRCRLNALDWK